MTDSTDEERVRCAPQTLHWRLKQVARELVGVDHSEEVVLAWKRLGIFYDIICGDVMTLQALRLEPRFDVIVAGDIIEHLSNPGLMLDGIRLLCRGDTEVIVTAPNAFGLPNFLRNAARCFREGGDHVIMFNEWGLENLAARSGFRVTEMYSGHEAQARRINAWPLYHLGKTLLRWLPHLGGTLISILKVAPANASVKAE